MKQQTLMNNDLSMSAILIKELKNLTDDDLKKIIERANQIILQRSETKEMILFISEEIQSEVGYLISELVGKGIINEYSFEIINKDERPGKRKGFYTIQYKGEDLIYSMYSELFIKTLSGRINTLIGPMENQEIESYEIK